VFTQRNGDEAAAALARKFAEVAREGVEAHGGSVIELRGDEALAVFGSARQAIRAAAELCLTFADETARQPELPLTVGIGLDAGEAVPVESGYRGGALNLAARLQAQAKAYEALASQAVVHLARVVPGITYEERGALELKGLAEPVRAFLLVPDAAGAVAPRQTPAAMAPGVASEDLPVELDPLSPVLVGRQAESRWLHWAWRQARRGSGRVVSITGVPGIGKTRLACGLAAAVHSEGGRIVYASASSEEALLLETMEAGRTAETPTLVVLDDLDAAGAGLLGPIRDLTQQVPQRPVMVLAIYNDEAVATRLETALGQAGRRRLHPLDSDAIREIATAYGGADMSRTVPAEAILQKTGGIPQPALRAVGEWARQQAAIRLGEAANRAAVERSQLREIETDVATNLFDVQLVSERAGLMPVVEGLGAGPDDASPYKGLASFEQADAGLFFGRERLVADMVARLAGSNFLAVVGPSGSGKSSALRAGLLPALRGGALPGSSEWLPVLLRPGDDPLRELDRALYAALPENLRPRLGGGDDPLQAAVKILPNGHRLLVVVDQFEEAFTSADGARTNGFLAALVHAAEQASESAVIVIAVRADYYGRCAAQPGLARLLAANQVLVGPMEADEYRRAIEQPARRAGGRVEPALVDALVGEVVDQPGGLPLLSSALLELWQRRTGRTIRMESYLATGGLRGAIARLAEDAYQSLDEADRGLARSILLRLAGPGEGESVVRRRVALSELDVGRNQSVQRVLDHLANRRLITVSEGSVEVAHEALLREWPRLVQWLEEDREGRRLRQHLIVAARDWDERGKDPSELYRGPRLSAALDWTTEHNLELNELEREFVTTSRAQSQRELTRQRLQNRRLRGLLAGVAGLLVLAVVAGSVAVFQRSSALAAARVALARQLGAEALITPRVDQAMLLARQSVLLDPSSQTEGTLLATLLRSPAVLGTYAMPIDKRPLRVALSSDGTTLAVGDNNNGIRFFDTRSHRESYPALSGYAQTPPFYAGPYLFAMRVPPKDPPTPANTFMDVFDATTMQRVRSLETDALFDENYTGINNPLVASPDGRRLYFAFTLTNADGSDGAAYVDSWDVDSGNLQVVPLGADGMSGAVLLPQNRLLLLTDTAAITLDTTTLRPIKSVPVDISTPFAAISPDGRTLAVQSNDFRGDIFGNTFSLVDLATGRRTPAAGSHSGQIDAMAFTPDGRSLVTTGDDGNVIVWNTSTGAPIETLTGHAGRVAGLAMSTDGNTIYTCALDGVIFAWDLGRSRRFGSPFTIGIGIKGNASQSFLPALAVSPDGSRFAMRGAKGDVAIVSTRTAEVQSSFGDGAGIGVTALAWSKRGQMAVGGGAGLQLWDVSGTPRLVKTLTVIEGVPRVVAFAADGGSLAAVTVVPAPNQSQPDDGWLVVWDLGSGKLRTAVHLLSGGRSVAFAPGAREVIAGADGPFQCPSQPTVTCGRVLVVDVASGLTERELRTIGWPPTALAFGAGGALLTGDWDGIVEHWDWRTGQQLAGTHPLLVAPAPVASISIAPAGGAFATTAGNAGGIKIWDEASLSQFGTTFPSNGKQIPMAAYTPDGKNLIVVFSDGSGAVWPLSSQAMMDHACQVAQRNFTQEEWNRFVPGYAYARTCPDFPSG
jgi:WD40 repeat protein